MREEWTDEKLIHGLRTGMEQAVGALIDRFGDRLLRAVHLIVQDRHLAEDILQETVIAAVQGIRRFRGESGLYTWLRGIAVNKCRMALRKKSPILLAEVPVAEDEHDVAAEAMRNVERRNLAESVASLPYLYREVITLHYYLQMSVEEIANALGSPTGTVKSRLQRGRRKLESMLTEVTHVETL